MTHYRGATIQWDVDSNNNTHFVIQGAWRANTIDNIFLDFGDGTGETLEYEILSQNSEYAVVRYETDHVYAADGNFTAFYESCCRISTLDDGNADNSFRSETIVNVGSGNSNPTTSLPPIIQVADNQIFTLQIPAADADGDPLTYRFGTSSEFYTSSSAPAGSTLSANGLFTWDVRDAGGAAVAAGDQYVLTVMVEDGQSKTPIDVILEIVGENTPQQNAPVISNVPPQTTAVGETEEVALFATDKDGNLQSIQALNPPPGLVTEYHADEGELHISFTPTADQAGQVFIVNFEARDSTGLTSQTSIKFTVPTVGQNVAPDAKDDKGLKVAYQTETTILADKLLANDTDTNGDTLEIISVGKATHGTVALDAAGDVTFTPANGYSGPASFEYTISDGKGGTDTAKVNLAIGAKPIPGGTPTNGNDSLQGTKGADSINGLGGDDYIFGNTGNDLLKGSTGSDTLIGGGGDDTLNGGDGDDVLKGSNGNDILLGSSGNDRLNGGTEDDTLVGGIGNDALIGGAGKDTFSFSGLNGSNSGKDLIADFNVNQDEIKLFGTTVVDITDGAKGAHIELSNGGEIIVKGHTAAELDAYFASI